MYADAEARKQERNGSIPWGAWEGRAVTHTVYSRYVMSKFRFLIDLFNLMTQELSGVNLRSDYEDGYEEEDVNSKGEHFLICCAI